MIFLLRALSLLFQLLAISLESSRSSSHHFWTNLTKSSCSIQDGSNRNCFLCSWFLLEVCMIKGQWSDPNLLISWPKLLGYVWSQSKEVKNLYNNTKCLPLDYVNLLLLSLCSIKLYLAMKLLNNRLILTSNFVSDFSDLLLVALKSPHNTHIRYLFCLILSNSSQKSCFNVLSIGPYTTVSCQILESNLFSKMISKLNLWGWQDKTLILLESPPNKIPLIFL